MKLALAPLALLAGLSLAACGSDDAEESGSAAPDAAAETTAAPAEAGSFCEALMATGTLEDGEDVAALREDLASTGLPEEAGADAAAGLEVYLDLLGRVEEDATAEDLAAMQDPKLSQEEQAQVDAMVQYATTTCATSGQDPESPSPSE